MLGAGSDAGDEGGEVGVRAFPFHLCFDYEPVDFGFVGVAEAEDAKDGKGDVEGVGETDSVSGELLGVALRGLH